VTQTNPGGQPSEITPEILLAVPATESQVERNTLTSIPTRAATVTANLNPKQAVQASSLMATSSIRRYAGFALVAVGTLIVAFSVWFTTGFSHPIGLSGQFLFLLIGIILGGPMIGYGGTLLWGTARQTSYALLAAGIDYIAIVLIYGWAVSDIPFLILGLAAFAGSYRYWRLAR
jgi:hypothetical protein